MQLKVIIDCAKNGVSDEMKYKIGIKGTDVTFGNYRDELQAKCDKVNIEKCFPEKEFEIKEMIK